MIEQHVVNRDPLIWGYVRTGALGPSLDQQRQALMNLGISPERIFEDDAGTIPKSRPGFEAMFEVMQKGDVIVVTSLSRIGRAMSELYKTVGRLHAKGVYLRSLAENLDGQDPAGLAIIKLLSTFSFIDNLLMEEKVLSSQAAGRRGKKLGPKLKMTPEKDDEAVRRLLAGENPREVAKAIGVGKSLLYSEIRGRLASRLIVQPDENH